MVGRHFPVLGKLGEPGRALAFLWTLEVPPGGGCSVNTWQGLEETSPEFVLLSMSAARPVLQQLQLHAEDCGAAAAVGCNPYSLLSSPPSPPYTLHTAAQHPHPCFGYQETPQKSRLCPPHLHNVPALLAAHPPGLPLSFKLTSNQLD